MGKSSLVLILLAAALMISGCSTSIASNNALPADDDAKEITVEIRVGADFYKNVAKEFQDETGVKVNIISNYTENLSDEVNEDYKKKIIAELVAGKGADIYADFYLNYYIPKYLCDMAKWVDQDPEINKDEYFVDILNSGRDQGKMYAIPVGFIIHGLNAYARVPELEGQDCLTWEQFFEKTKHIKRSGILYGLTDMDLFTRRFRERSTEFIDEKNKTQKLDTQELTRLLEQCKAWGEQRLCAKYSKWDPRAMDEAFFKEYFTDVCMVINKNNPFEDERYLYDMPSDSDSVNGYEIAMIPLLCINSNSRSKGTAWKFIKFLLSEKVQLALNYMPLNRKAAEMRIDEQISDLVILDLEKAKTNKQNILNLIEKVSSRASFFTLPSSCEKIVEAEARRYYLGEVSAEKAAKSMATKVELYLKEQN